MLVMVVGVINTNCRSLFANWLKGAVKLVLLSSCGDVDRSGTFGGAAVSVESIRFKNTAKPNEYKYLILKGVPHLYYYLSGV